MSRCGSANLDMKRADKRSHTAARPGRSARTLRWRAPLLTVLQAEAPCHRRPPALPTGFGPQRRRRRSARRLGALVLAVAALRRGRAVRALGVELATIARLLGETGNHQQDGQDREDDHVEHRRLRCHDREARIGLIGGLSTVSNTPVSPSTRVGVVDHPAVRAGHDAGLPPRDESPVGVVEVGAISKIGRHTKLPAFEDGSARRRSHQPSPRRLIRAG